MGRVRTRAGRRHTFGQTSSTHQTGGRGARYRAGLSKADNAKDEAEAKEVAKVPYRALIGMLSYIMGHIKPHEKRNVILYYTFLCKAQR